MQVLPGQTLNPGPVAAGSGVRRRVARRVVLPGESRANSFDALRLGGALAVLVSHSFALTRRPQPSIGPSSLGTIGVLMFFGISGFLITQSWLREPRFWTYAAKRALRILPALAFVLVITALVLGPLVTTVSPSVYFESSSPWHYMATNIVLDTRYQLLGVFSANPLDSSVNGSLWTLPVEVHAYAVVAVLGMLRILNRRVLASVAFIVVAVAATRSSGSILGIGSPDCFVAFGCGAVLYLWREKLPWNTLVAVALAVAAVALSGTVLASVTMDVAIPYLAIYLAYRLPGLARPITKRADLSYGVYVWAWPCQQLLAHWWPTVTPWMMILVVTVPVLVLAAVSWNLVEKRALGLKRHLRGRPSPIREVAATTGPT